MSAWILLVVDSVSKIMHRYRSRSGFVEATAVEASSRKRSFRPDSYKLQHWLEYSQIADAAFCYACRHFPSLGKTAEPAFTSAGFRKWKKVQYSDDGFAVHEDGDFHRFSLLAKNVGLLLRSTVATSQSSVN